MKASDIIEKWNSQAAESNQWDSLGEDEKIWFAFSMGVESVNNIETEEDRG